MFFAISLYAYIALHYTTLHYTYTTVHYITLTYIIYIYKYIYIYAIYYFCRVQLFYRFFTVAMSHLLGWCYSLTDHVCGIPVGTCLAMVKSGPQLRWLLDHLKPGRHTFSGIGKTIPWPKTKNQHVICRPVGKFDPCPKYRSSSLAIFWIILFWARNYHLLPRMHPGCSIESR